MKKQHKMNRPGTIKASGKGRRQQLIHAVRSGRNARDKHISYNDLFLVPVNRVSNRQIEHACFKRYIN